MVSESLCDNKEIIETNIRNVKISSPDVRSVFADDRHGDPLLYFASTVDGIQTWQLRTITKEYEIANNTTSRWKRRIGRLFGLSM